MACLHQLRRGSAAAWTLANPILAQGQLGLELDTGKVKIGNGVDDWNTLPYADFGINVITDHGALTGLADDDHPQYHNDARGDARYYTQTQLNSGQLDTRYFTEAEITALLAGYQPLDSDLTALAGLSTTGIIVRTGAGIATTRQIDAGTGISVTNATGVSGNPTITNSDTGSAAISTHIAALDPHTQYALESSIGVAGGIAPLDGSGLIPAVHLPSYVDDVLEFANLASFPVTGETGKIYVDLATNKTYRWSGTIYVEISASPGTTDSVPEGVTNLYFTQARVLATTLLGYVIGANTAISATDTVLSAFQKLQGQISAAVTTLTNHIGSGGAAHSLATTLLAGFMSPADKTKLDAIAGNRNFKSGNVLGTAFAGNPKTFAVVFGTAMPSTNYAIHITGVASRTWTYQAKTVNGFTINANANAAFTSEVSWTAILNGESIV